MEFNEEKVTNEIIDFIQKYYKKFNLKGAVIGISGGKDSAVVAGLFTKALGKNNVTGLWLPCHSKEEDKKYAIELTNYLGIELQDFDLTNIYDSFVKQIKENSRVEENNLIDANINIKPRLRMMTLYYYAAMLSKIKRGGYLVCGTSNKSEIFVGYYTKGGDNVSDIRVLADFYVDEVVKIGDYLGLPHHIVHKTPDDGLSGKSDEEKMGVKYCDIKKVEEEFESDAKNDNIDNMVREKVLKMHKNNLHKLSIPTFRRS